MATPIAANGMIRKPLPLFVRCMASYKTCVVCSIGGLWLFLKRFVVCRFHRIAGHQFVALQVERIRFGSLQCACIMMCPTQGGLSPW
jgi:hypothetical protein